MCLITFAYNVHPKYRLILAANRDEFYERPTRKAEFWDKEGYPDLLAGKDLKAGGTWMGTHTSGKWAALTNYRDPSCVKENPPSRGALVLDFLKSTDKAQDHLVKNQSRADTYSGYNLLLGDGSGVYHYSNVTDKISELETGIHGVSNALLDTSWPKLDQAKAELEEVIQKKEFEIERLFELLKNEHKPTEDQLPDTGIPKEWEKAVSSVFIKTDTYGTRCSTLLLIGRDDKASFIERRYNPKTSEIIEENAFKLVFS
ncbi:MAG: NRDE family protein [Balneolaceae bacterium]|nr:NRDE family protein [Balneolaceae bacterium]MBO6545035.1 NRDE family protein [Balneolaceae bacterium]MBO6646431.1 NRDE family protein [Balneolaceae bacterium]